MDVVAPTPTESRLSEGYSEGVPSILPNRRFNLRRSERFGELILILLFMKYTNLRI